MLGRYAGLIATHCNDRLQAVQCFPLYAKLGTNCSYWHDDFFDACEWQSCVIGSHTSMLTKQYQTGVCESLAKMIAKMFSWKFLLCLHHVFALLLCSPVLGWTMAISNVSLLSVPNQLLLLLCPDKNNMFAGRLCSFSACFGHVVAGLQKTFLYGALDMQPAGARHAVHLLRATF